MIIIVFGLPGTGKTFFSGHLAEETGAVHLNTDIIRERMNLRGKYDEKSKQRVYRELQKQAERELACGNDVIVDGTFHKRNRRVPFEKMAKAKNEPLYFIEIIAPEKIVQERLKGQRKYSEAGPDVYEELKKAYEPPDGEYLQVRSGDNTPESMIEKAKKYIYEQRTS